MEKKYILKCCIITLLMLLILQFWVWVFQNYTEPLNNILEMMQNTFFYSDVPNKHLNKNCKNSKSYQSYYMSLHLLESQSPRN